MERLINILQNQRGQSSSNKTSAAVSLIPRFSEEDSSNEGKSSPITHVNSILMSHSTWILDSGATDHIVCSIEFFNDFRTAQGAEVSLPTGKSIPVEHIGSVKLNEKLWLKDVLHIPSFKFNLISVSKLLQDTSCNLIFTPGQCLIQDTLGKTVGSAKETDGLYLMKELPRKQNVVHSSIMPHCNSGEI